MNSIFISPDLGTSSSGNIVSSHELEFLKSISENTFQLGFEEISPIKYGFTMDNPFMIDYLTMQKLSELDLRNIDFVHTYSGPFTNSIRFLKAKEIKVVSTIAAHNRIESIREFQNLGYDYPFRHISDDKLWKIYSGFCREADIVICPSKLSAEFMKQEGVGKVEIISHGIDIPSPDKIKPINEKEFSIGYLGATGPDKGLVYLIRAFSDLDYKDSSLMIAGSNSEQLGPFINKHVVCGNFLLMGYVPDISDFYNKISVHVQPSVSEGFGLEVLEAASYSRPVICSNGAGASDFIEDGENGFIFEKRNIKELSDKIQYFKDNPREIIRMGRNAREKSLNYDWSIIRKKYIDLWKSLLDQK